jgi:hypothetical protein
VRRIGEEQRTTRTKEGRKDQLIVIVCLSLSDNNKRREILTNDYRKKRKTDQRFD